MEGSRINSYREIGSKIWEWLIQQQTREGGFPPFSDLFIGESGVITTSEFLEFLFTPPCITEGLLNDWYYDEYFREKIFKPAKSAKDYILSRQLSGGGFPPDGDVYGIKDVTFNEVTAASIIALSIYLRRFESFSHDKENTIIKHAMIDGVKNLVQSMDKTSFMWPTLNYQLGEEERINESYRYFPLIKIRKALDLSKNLLPDKHDLLEIIIKNIDKRILSKLEKDGYLPFSLKDNTPSIVNTLFVYNVYLRENLPKKGLEYIPEHLEKMTSNVELEKMLLTLPDEPPIYYIHRRKDLIAAHVFSYMLLSQRIELSLLGRIKSYTERIIKEEMEEIQKSKEYYVKIEGGRDTYIPSISATILLLSSLNNYILWKSQENEDLTIKGEYKRK